MNLSILEREFERESDRIDQLVWDAMAIRAGESVLFCGFSNNLEWIKRAAGIEAEVSVVSDDTDAIRELKDLPVTMLRGSTSMLPARDSSFDVTIAFHYLHEVDPFFHANVVSELARVGKRTVIVEPAPPSDPLGLRIASLYSRAKRELGQFENYHHIDYWRKLLAIVKADVRCQTFSFLRTPPARALKDTVALIIDTMAAEDTPASYIAELRALAARPDAQLVPQSRCVIVGTASGLIPALTGSTEFRERLPIETVSTTSAKPFVPPTVRREIGSAPAGAGSATRQPTPFIAPTVRSDSTLYTSAETEPEFPAIIPPAPDAADPKTIGAAPVSQIARNAFGLPAEPEAIFSGQPFSEAPADDEAAFGISDAAPPADFGWAWEPPENATE